MIVVLKMNKVINLKSMEETLHKKLGHYVDS